MAEVIVVHGYPGSGRTTHSKQAVQDGFDGRLVRHVSAGNRIRAIRLQETISDYSDYVRSSETPAHLPDDIVNGIVFEAIGTPADNEILLIDGYPRYAQAITVFRASLEENNHALLGTIALNTSLETSITRVLSRERRMDDAISDQVLESETIFQYNRHDQTTGIAILGLSTFTATETIDANSDKDTVYADFIAALGRLACHTK